MTVVADTSSLNYAVLIDEADTLHRLYGSIVIPEAVFRELQSIKAPELVRRWVANRPEWLHVKSAPTTVELELAHLARGEREAIALAEQLVVNAATELGVLKQRRRVIATPC